MEKSGYGSSSGLLYGLLCGGDRIVDAGTGLDPGSEGTKWGFQGAEHDSAARLFQSLTTPPSDCNREAGEDQKYSHCGEVSMLLDLADRCKAVRAVLC